VEDQKAGCFAVGIIRIPELVMNWERFGGVSQWISLVLDSVA